MGAWIEIFPINNINDCCCTSRTPRWVRGLKLKTLNYQSQTIMSHPTMGAWIEIVKIARLTAKAESRTPRWVRGLKYRLRHTAETNRRRTPRWVRGLKFQQFKKSPYIQRRTPRWVRGLKFDM